MNPLERYFKENEGRIIHKWMHYFEIYHKHFQKFRNKECVLLEIGVSMGGSLQMWKYYLGDRVKIYAIDIDPDCKQFEDESTKIFIGSQSDREFLRNVISKIPKIDILIDDGGHKMDEQIISFEELYNHIKQDGIYFCEDTHTSYWKEYGGGYQKDGSFIEYAKNLVDHINAWHIKDNELEHGRITNSANSIHFYDSVFVLEKGVREKPHHEMTGSYTAYEEGGKDFDLFLFKLRLLGIEIAKPFIPDYFYYKPEVLKSISPEKFQGTIWPEKGETMIGYQRLSNLEYCIKDILKNDVEGDFIETGVWKGGASIFMKAILEAYGIEDRNIYLADSFEGFPPPNEERYPADKGLRLNEAKELAIPIEEVKNNFRKYDLLDDRVKFIKGWFKDTLPSAPVSKLSLLRLDGDLYESTIDALYNLYHKLSVGGYCIIDDWGALPACRKAVEDFRKIYGIDEEILEIDWTGVFWKKEKEIQPLPKEKFDASILKKPRQPVIKSSVKKILKSLKIYK